MSTILEIIASAKACIECNNWHAALIVSVTIPDICCALEHVKTSQSKYIAWHDKYMMHKYKHAIGLDDEEVEFLNGNDFYALRYALLHEGNSNITL